MTKSAAVGCLSSIYIAYPELDLIGGNIIIPTITRYNTISNYLAIIIRGGKA